MMQRSIVHPGTLAAALATAVTAVACSNGGQALTPMTPTATMTSQSAVSSTIPGMGSGLAASGARARLDDRGRSGGGGSDRNNRGDTGDDHGNSGGNSGNPGAAPGRVEVNGAIAAGSLTGSCAAHTLSFVVGTTRVITNTATQFEDGSCATLTGGSRVEVKGTRQADKSVLATRVEGPDDNDNGENQTEVRGAIVAGSFTGSCAASSLSFRIGTTTLRTNAQTRFEDLACAALTGGTMVEARGVRQADGSVLASRVEAEDAEAGHEND